eukprot:4349397-Alexandrium_andersonii.AAC.1
MQLELQLHVCGGAAESETHGGGRPRGHLPAPAELVRRAARNRQGRPLCRGVALPAGRPRAMP